jgi:ribonuclease HI
MIVVYTDGACSGNPGPGGWGVLIENNGDAHELCGGEGSTTNNRMELMAAIKALESLKPGTPIRLVTDSNYVKDGIESWLPKWKNNGWKTAAKKPVKNDDLWRLLDAQNQRHDVTWKWVRGHDGDPGNERADALARQGMAPYQ